jgi:hypothetical protein
MEWIPKGPDFVFQPRDQSYTRLSLYNEFGFQGRPTSIAVDPTNQHIIYVLDRPGETKGITIFRKREDSLKWDPITDSLRNSDPSIDPSCITINPADPNIIYVGTYNNGKVYRGEVTIGTNGSARVTWGPGRQVGTGISKIIVDPRNSYLYAACLSGLYYTIYGIGPWRRILNGRITSVIGYFPNSDWSKSYIYAGCYRKGVYHIDAPYNDLDPDPDNVSATRRWISLSTGGSMLPPYTTSTAEPRGNFDHIFIESTPRNPNRIYVWLLKETADSHVTEGLYTTANATTGWTRVVANPMLPDPFQNLTNAVFAVSPNSPGDDNGNRDILFFGGLTTQRSVDGGRTWSGGNADFHPDMHSIAFFQDNANPTHADVYIGCDGGIAYCPHFADYTFRVDPISLRPPNDPSRIRFNQADRINERDGQFMNINHGRPSSIIYSYSSHPEFSTLEYVACQDTGISASSGTSCWRGIVGGDTYDIGVEPGWNGIKIFASTGMYDTRDYGWPALKLTVLTDKLTDQGTFETSSVFPSFPSNGSNLHLTSNIVTLDKKSFSGCYVLESNTDRKLHRPIQNANPTTVQKAYPSSMSGILNGSHLILDERNDNIEGVTVINTGLDPDGARYIRAIFTKPHVIDAPIRLMKSVVVSVDANTSGLPSVTQLGQDFGVTSNPNPGHRMVDRIGMSQNLAYRDKICCATQDEELWTYNSGIDRWIRVQKPNDPTNPALSYDIQSITINGDGDIYWLLKNPVTLNTSNGSITTPLFRFIEIPDADPQLGQWEPQFLQFTTPLPFGYDYEKLVTHPQRPDIIFLSYGMKILKLTRSNSIGLGNPPVGGWQCEDISLNLPKQYINDLWIGEIKNSEGRNVLLRAVLSTRGVWEVDISQTGTGPASGQPILYMRDNILDHGWLNRSPPLSSSVTTGISNPYKPDLRLWHYQCPDIKLDLEHPSGVSGLGGSYYQVDPETPLPFYQRDPGVPYPVANPPEISYNFFELIKDRSEVLIQRSNAWVHIQVHNYSNIEAHDVYVWAIFCNAAAGVPSLNARSNMPANNTFNFWNQINNPPGRISPNLPSDSRWTSIGEPRRLTGITADNPKVASWKWNIPQLSPRSPGGHYCIVAFIHSRSNPIRETHTDVGVIVGRNRQIAQKNLHILSGWR